MDARVESTPQNDAVRTLPPPQAGDTVSFQLFAAAAAGQSTNGYVIELDLPGRTFSSDIGTLLGVDWNGDALVSAGPAGLSALFLSPATAPSTGYLGQINVPVTTALDSGDVLRVKRMTMTSGNDLDQLDVSAAAIAFATGGNPGDFDNDGTVGLSDFLMFVRVFGTSSSDAGFDGRMDFDDDGTVDLTDFEAFVKVFGTTYARDDRPLAGGSIRRLTNHTADDRAPAWSPDGRYVIFTSNRDDNDQIYVMEADGSDPRRLTRHEAYDAEPAWSPDGRRIAFMSDRDGHADIYVMGADGSDPRRLTRDDAYDSQPAWSPDGRHIAFTSDRDDYFDVYVMGADGSDPRRLTRHDAYDSQPAWSPDGRRIAFVSDRDGNDEIYVMEADGSDPRRLTDVEALDVSPAWSPDGRRIAYSSLSDSDWEIYVIALQDGGP